MMKAVSCIMVTLDRLDCFTRSFACYCDQTYPNKELIIVSDGTPEYRNAILDTISQSGRDDIRTSFVSRKPLGALRSHSIEVAGGDLICQWDDDDLNHPARLSNQIQCLNQLGVDATFLSEHLQVFEDTGIAHLWNWNGVAGEFAHPGTLLGYKGIMPAYNRALSNREDLELQQKLFASGHPIGLISGLGPLHVYTFHGNNTFSRAHHETLNFLCAESKSIMYARELLIRRSLVKHRVAPPLKFVDSLEEEVFAWSGHEVDSGPEIVGTVMGLTVTKTGAGSLCGESPVLDRFATYGLVAEEYSLKDFAI